MWGAQALAVGGCSGSWSSPQPGRRRCGQWPPRSTRPLSAAPHRRAGPRSGCRRFVQISYVHIFFPSPKNLRLLSSRMPRQRSASPLRRCQVQCRCRGLRLHIPFPRGAHRRSPEHSGGQAPLLIEPEQLQNAVALAVPQEHRRVIRCNELGERVIIIVFLHPVVHVQQGPCRRALPARSC